MLRPCYWLVPLLLACSSSACVDPDPDSDGDGFPLSRDCDDGDVLTYPGAEDVCYDGIDQDCMDGDRIDCDGDGFKSRSHGGNDCDDDDSRTYPAAVDIPYDGIDQDCVDGDLVDQDGDGFASIVVDGGDDCNDSSNAVYPGASELPYDGLDQDCDGRDLEDVDGDGQRGEEAGGTDCDDTDPDVYEGASEVAYDGIDQDCEDGDLDDLDRDGSRGGEDGEDCDDGDPSIHPGAEDIAYDGIDQDCVGGDRVDLDKDGVLLPADCDDGDPAVYPGASEVSCNGIDEDCDGLALDQDCDSHTALASGGDDCDDVNPLIHPEAEEISCNAVDEDCDAELSDADCDGEEAVAVGGTDCDDEDKFRHTMALERLNGLDDNCDGSVDERQSVDDAAAVLTGEANQSAGAAVAMGDLDGDGIVDLAVGAPGDDETPGAVYVFAGTPAGFADRPMRQASYVITSLEAGDRCGAALAFGDVDGDGHEDLIIGAPGSTPSNQRPGRVYIFQGGSTLSWGPRASLDMAAYTLSGGATGGGFGSSISFTGDVDGDGVGDILVGAPNVNGAANARSAGAAYLFRGSESMPSLRVAAEADAVLTGSSAYEMTGAFVAGVGDINRDGLVDAAVSAPGAAGDAGRIAVFFGSSDLSGWKMSSPSLLLAAEAGAGLGPVARTGDLNEDGIDDLLLGAPTGGANARGKVYLLFGREAWPQATIELSSWAGATWFGEGDGDRLGSSLVTGHIDNDGLPDIIFGAPQRAGGRGAAYLFFGRPGNEWGTFNASSADSIWDGNEPDQHVGVSMALGDLDDDTREELTLGATGDNLGGELAGAAFVYFWN